MSTHNIGFGRELSDLEWCESFLPWALSYSVQHWCSCKPRDAADSCANSDNAG